MGMDAAGLSEEEIMENMSILLQYLLQKIENWKTQSNSSSEQINIPPLSQLMKVSNTSTFLQFKKIVKINNRQ